MTTPRNPLAESARDAERFALSRRDFARRSMAGCAALGCWLTASVSRFGLQAADNNPEHSAAEFVTDEVQLKVEQGLAFLATQQRDDGSFGQGGYSHDVAVAGLAGMAFMASGSTPGRGPYGENVERCIDYVLANCQESGYINVAGSGSHGPMYGHGFATLFLAETYGMTRRAELRDKLSAAVRLIIDTQNADGGWRYQPVKRDADLSVTICQVMALRAARNAGIFVPHNTIDQCVAYVKRSQNADGGFMYMVQGGQSAFPRSAAGIVALYSAGIYEGPEIERGLKFLLEHVPQSGRGMFSRGESHYFYGHYYAVQAMWHAGGDYWRRWYPAVRDELIMRQREDGSWNDSICSEYGTAMACIVLQIPNNYLPIFQR